MTGISPGRLLRSRIATAATLLISVAVVALTLFVVARLAPDGDRDLREYEAAARCPAAPSAPADCRWTEPFTVSGIDTSASKGESDHAYLTGADGTRWTTYYSSDGPVLENLQDGDRVTGTVWRGHLTEIAAEGATQRTHDAPADYREQALIGALIVVPAGAVLAAVCAWRLVRRAGPAPTPGMAATMALSFALFGAGLLSPLPFAGGEASFWAVAAVWLPVAVLMAVAARVYVVRNRPA